MTAAARRGLLLAAAITLALLPWLAERSFAPDAAFRLPEARFGETVEDDRQRTRPMPHRWADDCPACRTVWYRFDITLPGLPRDDTAVYLPAAAHNAAVYLNGRLLAQGGRFSEPVARLGSGSLWAVTAPNLWNPGANRIDVLAKAEQPRAGFVTSPAVGPEQALRWAWRLRELWARTLPQLLAVAAAMLGVVMALVWFQRRHERAYAALALAALAHALHAGVGFVAEPPWSGWDGWLQFTAWLAAAAAALLAVQLVAALQPRPARISGSASAMLAAGVLAAGAALAAAAALEASGAAVRAAQAAASLLAAATGAWLAARGWRGAEATPDARLLLPGIVLLVAHLADLGRGFAEPGAVPLQPYAAAVWLGAASWLLLLRFVQTLNAVELLNIDLEALVESRTAELQAQFERVRELERRQTVASERERLMRDMHDGVGGHLVSLLAMIEADRRRPGELALAVRDALDDMRLMIDSLEPVDDDLNAVLAMWRDRLAPRLRQLGVTLHWEVALLPAVPGLTPSRVLHVLRMLQEAVTNALRHGGARTLWLEATAADGRVTIVLRDDGVGFDPAAAASGRGLKNMRRRAEEVGLALAIDSVVGGGTTVRLDLDSHSPRS